MKEQKFFKNLFNLAALVDDILQTQRRRVVIDGHGGALFDVFVAQLDTVLQERAPDLCMFNVFFFVAFE